MTLQPQPPETWSPRYAEWQASKARTGKLRMWRSEIDSAFDSLLSSHPDERFHGWTRMCRVVFKLMAFAKNDGCMR